MCSSPSPTSSPAFLTAAAHQHQICQAVHLGDKNAAADLDLLNRLGVTHIITAELIPLPEVVTSSSPHLAVLHICVADMPEADLLTHLERTTRFIRAGVESGGVVLVHCYHGVSRSATIVAAYLMRTRGLDARAAVDAVRAIRPQVCPNDGFTMQLKLFGRMGCKLDTDCAAFKLYRMQCIQHLVLRSRMIPHEARDLVCTDKPKTDPRTAGALYRCRKCRAVLATQANVIPHKARQPLTWPRLMKCERSSSEQSDSSDNSTASPATTTPPNCTESLFLEPLPWMSSKLFSSLGERLHCGKCQGKLGSFSWAEPVSCSCGASVAPGIVVNAGRVDRCSMLKEIEVNL